LGRGDANMRLYQVELPEDLLQTLIQLVDNATFRGSESERVSVLRTCLRSAKEVEGRDAEGKDSRGPEAIRLERTR